MNSSTVPLPFNISLSPRQHKYPDARKIHYLTPGFFKYKRNSGVEILSLTNKCHGGNAMTSQKDGPMHHIQRPQNRAPGAEPSGTWEILNPETPVHRDDVKTTHRPGRLDGKTIVLRRNDKANSDIFLNRVGELLDLKGENINIIKAWEIIPQSDAAKPEPAIIEGIAKLEPDLVISSQGD